MTSVRSARISFRDAREARQRAFAAFGKSVSRTSNRFDATLLDHPDVRRWFTMSSELVRHQPSLHKLLDWDRRIGLAFLSTAAWAVHVLHLAILTTYVVATIPLFFAPLQMLPAIVQTGRLTWMISHAIGLTLTFWPPLRRAATRKLSATEHSRVHSKATAVFDVIEVLLPTSMCGEMVGDALELLARMAREGRPVWHVYAKIFSTVIWISYAALAGPVLQLVRLFSSGK